LLPSHFKIIYSQKFGNFVSQKFQKTALRNFESWLAHVCYILHARQHGISQTAHPDPLVRRQN